MNTAHFSATLFIRMIIYVVKNAVFWDVAPCVAVLQPPAHAGSSLADFLNPEDGGDMFLWNIS
jgi:hypothetical protein